LPRVSFICGLLFTLLGARAEAAGVLEGRLAADTGYDSNIYRNFNDVPGLPVVGGLFLQLQADLAGRSEFIPGQRSDASLLLGVRLFGLDGCPSGEQSPNACANTYVGQLHLGHAIRLNQRLTLRFDAGGKEKLVTNGELSYSDLGAGVSLSTIVSSSLVVDVRVGVHVFNYFPDSAYSESGPAFSVGANQSLGPDHSIFFLYRLLPEYYEGYQLLPNLSIGGKRFDWFHMASIGYALQRPVIASASYSFIYDHSNSFGESYIRNRIEVVAGLNLPLEITLAGTAALQATTYPDGIYLSPQIFLVEDDENLTELSIKLFRDLGRGFSLEGRFSIYRNDLSKNSLSYRREVVYVGVSYRP
jgi:hypothetical protein